MASTACDDCSRPIDQFHPGTDWHNHLCGPCRRDRADRASGSRSPREGGISTATIQGVGGRRRRP